MMSAGLNLEQLHYVEGLAPVVPSTSTPDYVSLKNVHKMEVLIHAKNGTTVTGSAITLKQASDVAGTNEKALPFTTYYRVADTAAADAPWTKVAAVSNTFTTNTTNSKNFYYRIPIDPATLDTNGGFDCVRAGTGDAVNSTISIHYVIVPKFGGNVAAHPSFIVD